LTIKFTLDTVRFQKPRIQTSESQLPILSITSAPHCILAAQCVLQLVVAHQYSIVKEQTTRLVA